MLRIHIGLNFKNKTTKAFFIGFYNTVLRWMCFWRRFLFNDTTTTEIYTLPLPDALPIPPVRKELGVRTILNVLEPLTNPARDIVCLNAGAALYAANVAPSMAEGLQRAQQALASGAALAKLHELVAYTQKLAA